MDRVLWAPSEQVIEKANITAYSRWLEEEKGIHARGYPELWAWSVRELESSRSRSGSTSGYMASGRYSKVLDSRTMPGAKWFSGSSLNYAEHIFRERDQGKTAILLKTEQEKVGSVSWGELAGKGRGVRRLAQEHGRRQGGQGGRVPPEHRRGGHRHAGLFERGGHLVELRRPTSEPIARSTGSDQIEPKVLVAAYGYSYRGKWNSKAEAVGQIREAIPSIERTVMVGQETYAGRALGALGRPFSSRREAGFRACPLRPSAVDSVLVGDDGAPEADRARARGDPHGALQDAGPSQRPEAG